jgi:RNA polymerase sigma-70 factor (ECF subfamily)
VDDSGRRQRFEAVAAEVMEPVRRYLARRTDPATADDVLSEVLLVVWRRLDDVPDEVLPWTYGVARHCLANAERTERRQGRVAGRISVVDPPRETTDEPGPRDEVLHEALEVLTSTERELVALWAWEQLTPAEIATVLDVTPNAVSLRLLRAKTKLAEEIRKIEAGAGHEESRRRSP